MDKKIVFISHITEEKELAQILSEEIKRSYLGMLDTFVSSDGQSLPAGGRWLDMIDSALNQSAIQISLCSPQSIKRPWINFEAGASWIRKIPVVPVCHSGLRKNALPIPLAMLQAADIDNKDDLNIMFNELTKVLGATISPTIDFNSIIERSSEFQKNYTYVNVIKNAVYMIINICPELSELFLSGGIQSHSIQIRDFQYNDVVHHLEYLAKENLVSYAFNQTVMNGLGTFKGGTITVTSHYLNDVINIIR
ncbi:toll/interleukin-1 receptor domain-containing protein [Leclercia adecarboxylata]|uniref:toll/interleukin-1 receptor domain-containing protein n=1 Tax=Leclercia adecarboxylata TaxID=83655 RepID=UPI001E3677A0|nr:toll/interleukin-1 receptor domain-containing protein [Leclercia adecarboxylata]UFM71254.1 toll/interleukin-1 receptor domain-containing protein [Leclercia adecarboxylata]